MGGWVGGSLIDREIDKGKKWVCPYKTNNRRTREEWVGGRVSVSSYLS